MEPDDIYSRVLKELKDHIHFLLYCIMQQSIDESTLPGGWKVAYVTPIFKKGKKMLADNCRPVSLTFHICVSLRASCQSFNHLTNLQD